MTSKSTAGKITAASLAAEREARGNKKSKLTSQQFTVGDANWQLCPICTGYFVPGQFRLTVGTQKIEICAWCFGRGGKFLLLFIQFVEQYSNRSCEIDDMDRMVEKCKCGPCVARLLLDYRDKVVGVQVAPIKIG